MTQKDLLYIVIISHYCKILSSNLTYNIIKKHHVPSETNTKFKLFTKKPECNDVLGA